MASKMLAFTILKLCIFVSIFVILTEAKPTPDKEFKTVAAKQKSHGIEVSQGLKRTWQNGLNFVRQLPEKVPQGVSGTVRKGVNFVKNMPNIVSRDLSRYVRRGLYSVNRMPLLASLGLKRVLRKGLYYVPKLPNILPQSINYVSSYVWKGLKFIPTISNIASQNMIRLFQKGLNYIPNITPDFVKTRLNSISMFFHSGKMGRMLENVQDWIHKF